MRDNGMYVKDRFKKFVRLELIVAENTFCEVKK